MYVSKGRLVKLENKKRLGTANFKFFFEIIPENY